jgi:hypothetical protein
MIVGDLVYVNTLDLWMPIDDTEVEDDGTWVHEDWVFLGSERREYKVGTLIDEIKVRRKGSSWLDDRYALVLLDDGTLCMVATEYVSKEAP